MKWGLITDTHNQRLLVEKAIAVFTKEHCSHVFHCGDFTNEKIFNMFCGQKFNFHFVTDHKSHDSYLLNNNKFFYEEIDGFTVGMMHDTYEKFKLKDSEFQVSDFISTNIFDYFFYGHLHYLNFKLHDADSKTVAINSGGFYLDYWYDNLYTFCILEPEKKIMEVYYYFNNDFINIFRIDLSKPMDKCIMYYSGTPLRRYFKVFFYHKDRLSMSSYSFSNSADHLWLNKNLEVFDKMK